MLINAEIERPDLNLLELEANLSDFSAITDLFLCIPTFHFNSLTDFRNRDKWNEAIIAGNIIPIHDIYESVDQSEQIQFQESKQNNRIEIKKGKYRFTLSLCVNLEYHKELKKYAGQNLKCFTVDINGNYYGVMSGSMVIPFNIEPLIIDKIFWGAGSVPSWTNIYLGFTDPDQMLSAVIEKLDFIPEDLYNINCNLSLTHSGSYDTIFDYSFRNSTGLDIASNGVYNTYAPTGPVFRGFQIVLNTPGNSEPNFVRIFSTDHSTISSGEYRLSINLVSKSTSGTAILSLLGDDSNDYILTVGINTISLTTTGINDIMLEFRSAMNEQAAFLIKDWKLERVNESSVSSLTIIRPDGEQISNVKTENITITDETNGNITFNLTGTDGVYQLQDFSAMLTSGVVTFKSDNYHGIYTYNFS